MATCGKCGRTIQFFESHCECGEFHSYPNVRVAREEVAQLEQRYNQAQKRAVSKATSPQLNTVERITEAASAVVNVSVRVADCILRDDKYRNYYQSLAAGLRIAAEMKHHAERTKVDATFFPEYYPHIISMALSADGRGLISYGPVTMTVNDQEFLTLRGSLLERNTYQFYDEHDLGNRKSAIPPGYRAVWNGKSMLAATKLEPRLNRFSTLSDIEGALLTVTTNREKDEYIEVHIFAQGGIRRDKFSSVKLQRPLTDEEDQDRWQLIRKNGDRLGIPVIE